MKTSSSQFDLMVTYMEQHGDLSKPSNNARGRMASIKNWEELGQFSNSDGSGDTKTTEKWKKGTYVQANPTVNLEQGILTPQPPQSVECTLQPAQDNIAPQLPPTLPRAIFSPSLAFTEEVQSSQPWNNPGPSTQPHVAPAITATSPVISFVEVQMENTGTLSPTMLSSQVQDSQPEPALSGQTTPCRARPIRTQRSPRRLVRPAHTEQAGQQFLQAEEHWRNFKRQQHQEYMDLRRERNRIRELELQSQREWQALGLRAIDMLDKVVNKYCKD